MAKAIGDLRKKKCLFMMKKNELSHKLVGYSLLNIMKMGKVEIELSPNLAPHLLGLKTTTHNIYFSIQPN